jgi:gliding motility-associated-like protein
MNRSVFSRLWLNALIIAMLGSFSAPVFSQNQTAKVTPGGIWYYEYLPSDYATNSNKYPVVFFLHGLGERGDTESELYLVAKNGPPKHVKNGYKFPFILISPQLKTKYSGWPNSYIDAVIEHCKTNLRIDLSRVYLTGLSLGGGGAWGYSQDAILGQKLAAVAVICGSSNNPTKACNYGLTNLPVWAFHGDADNTVSVNKTINMVNAINACDPAPNPLAQMTIYAGVGHNSWDRAYLTDNTLHTPNLYQWLLQFKNDGIIVNAGADQIINLPTNSTTISGSATVISASITSYAWTKVNGPSVTMTNTSTATLSLSNLVEGIYTFRLAVTASNGETAYDDVKVTVVSSNQNPVADAGPDITITLPTNSVTLNGKGSDPDGSISSYLWAKVSGPSVTMSGTTTTSLSLSNLLEGTYIFSFTVQDNAGATATDEVKVIVNAATVNQLPTANAGPDQIINLPTNNTSLPGSGSDADGSIVSYLWEKISGPACTLSNTTNPTAGISNLVSGVYVFRLTVKDNSNASASDEVSVTVVEANKAPVANAGDDIALVLPANSTNLNGSGSDSDGSVVSYHWTFISGPSTPVMTNTTSPTASVSSLIEGTYTFRLEVTDDKSATAIDDVKVIVQPASINSPPTANAGPDKIINLPTNSTTLSGSGSDSDGSIISYKWSKTSGPSVTISNSTSPTVSLGDLVEGIYEFKLTVTDDKDATGSDAVTVTVVSANQSPVANAGNDIAIKLPTDFATLTGSGSDADGSVQSYLWTQVGGPAQAAIANPSNASTTVSGLVVGVYTFNLTVTDNNGATGSDEVSVVVSEETSNLAPVASAGPDKSVNLPTNSIVLYGSGSDADGSIVSYSWLLIDGPSVTMSGQNTTELSLSNLVAGTYTFRLVVTDNLGATGTDDVHLIVQPEEVNQAPTANAGSDLLVKLPETTATISGSGHDADGTISSYSWMKMSGPSVTMAGENTATLNLSALVEGTYIFELTVTDDKGASGTDHVQVVVSGTNQPPVSDAGSDIILQLPENSVTITGNATDADGTIVSYTWSQLSGPTTATMTIANIASVLVSNLEEGTYVFNLMVTDDDGATANDQVKVVVNAENSAPTVTVSSNRNITLPLNKTTFTANASDSDGTITAYNWIQVSGPEPAILANEQTATVTVTVAVAGIYWFRITVTDNLGATAFADARLTVNPPAENQAPVADAGANQTITLPTNSTVINGTGSDSDGTIASYQWTKVSGPSVTMTNTTTAVLSLADMVEGTYVFRLTVTDNGGLTGQDDVSVHVIPASVNATPTANAGPDKILTLPTNSLNITGSGSDPDGSIITYSWTKVSGPDAVLSNTASATVSISGLVEGIYTFRLTVTDDKGATASDDVNVTVNAESVNQAPMANAGPDKTINLPTNTTTLSGSGSDPDGSITSYLWTKVSGPSVTLSGANNPTVSLSDLVEGSYVFRLTVTDNGGLTGRDDAHVTVLAQTVNQVPTANAGADKTITLPTNSVTLFGSASDPDGTITSYLWTQISGPAATLDNANMATLSVSSMVSGTYVFQLTVSDDKGATGSDQVTVTVNAESVNQLPTANAGPDKVITLPTSSATLTGSGSDPDGSIAGYAWAKLSGPSVTMSSLTMPTLSLSDLVEGTYVFRLTVTDNAGADDDDDVTVTVMSESVNSAPTANAGKDILIIAPANSVTLEGSGSDSDGKIISVLWTQTEGASTTMSAPGAYTNVVANLVTGSYKFRLTVTDDKGASASDDVVVTVQPENTNQLPVANAGPDKSVKLPTNTLSLAGSATDADGTISSYFWEKISGPSVSMNGINTATLNLFDLVEGSYSFRLTVTDNAGGKDDDIVMVSVINADVNLPPTANAGPDRSLDLPENEVTLSGTADDDNVDELIFLWEKISGPEATLQNSDQKTVTVSGLSEGVYEFRFTVMDAGGLSDYDDVVVTVFAGESDSGPPMVSAGTDIQIQLPVNHVTIHADASAPDGLIVSYQWLQLEGAPVNFDPESADVLVLENLGPGVYLFSVTVTDALGRTASDQVFVRVLEESPEIRPRKLFSPDQRGEASTEHWVIENAHLIENCEITVFDRQGQEVYHSIGYPNPWNGTRNNNPLPDGAYFYTIRCGGKIIKTGTVTIARLK